MKRKSIAFLLFVLLTAGCAAQPVAPASTVFPAATETPQSTPSPVVTVPQGQAYEPSGEELLYGSEELHPYRALPAVYSDDELRAVLEALPKIDVEQAITGPKKFYVRDNENRAGYLTRGSITEDGLSALLKSIEEANKPDQMLKELLEAQGLSYQAMSPYLTEDFPLYDEGYDAFCTVTQTRPHKDVLCVTLTPRMVYRNIICHLVFKRENGLLRFAAMTIPGVNTAERNDRVIEENGAYYFGCLCNEGWGTGVSEVYGDVFSLEEGAHEYLRYAASGYDSVHEIVENHGMDIKRLETTENGGVHLVLRDAFYYENMGQRSFPAFSEVFSGAITYHVYDDLDGKGLYTYAEDTGTDFWRTRSTGIVKAFSERLQPMLQAVNEDICLLAENIIWETYIKPEGYPFLTTREEFDRQEAIQEKAYTPGENNGTKYIIGNDAPVPTGGGTLSGNALLALQNALLQPDADVAACMEAAELVLPTGIEIPDEAEVYDGEMQEIYADYGNTRRMIRHEEGPAIALELCLPGENADGFASLFLLFTYDEKTDVHTFLTALTDSGSITEQENRTDPFIMRIGDAYLFHHQPDPADEPNGSMLFEDVWIPFEKGGTVTRLRLNGGCTLNPLPGRPLEYRIEMQPDAISMDNGRLAYKMEISYFHSQSGLRFRMPLTLYNDGDGLGFYSLDRNSKHFFGDVLSAPYARQQIKEQLAVLTKSPLRENRANAIVLKTALFGYTED